MRLVMLCHGPTAATRAARFPAGEPLEAGAAARIAAIEPRWPRRAAAFTSPAPCARATAAALGLVAAVQGELADADHGAWAGRTLAEVAASEPDALRRWLADPEARPGGGESDAAVGRRVAAWLAARLAAGEPAVAVTHAAVLRAAVVAVLGATPGSGRAIDVAPLASLVLGGDGRRWRLVGLVPP